MPNYRIVLAFIVLIAANATSLRAETMPQLPTVELRGDSSVAPGSEFIVSVFLTDSSKTIGGFDFLIEFDFGAFVFDSATFGAHTAGQWEYLTTRSALLSPDDTGSTSGFIRLLAIADNQDGANKHPSPKSLVGPGEFARIYLYATDRAAYQGKISELKFLWNKCSDNSISDLTGNTLLLANSVTAASGELMIGERYSGPSKKCLTTGHNAPQRAFDFFNHSILIK